MTLESRIRKLELLESCLRTGGIPSECAQSSNAFNTRFIKLIDFWLENPESDPSNESVASNFARRISRSESREEAEAVVAEMKEWIGKRSGREDKKQWCLSQRCPKIQDCHGGKA
jgi:hypothetical protein